MLICRRWRWGVGLKLEIWLNWWRFGFMMMVNFKIWLSSKRIFLCLSVCKLWIQSNVDPIRYFRGCQSHSRTFNILFILTLEYRLMRNHYFFYLSSSFFSSLLTYSFFYSFSCKLNSSKLIWIASCSSSYYVGSWGLLAAGWGWGTEGWGAGTLGCCCC